MRSFIPLTAAALLAVVTTAADSKSGKAELAALAEPAGPPVECLQLREIKRTRVVDDQVVDFFMKNKDVYRNTLANSCQPLATYEKFSYHTTAGRLCSSDTITVFDNSGHTGPTCGLGSFQPISVPPAYH